MLQCGDQIWALWCTTGSLRVKEWLCAKGRVKGMQQFEYVRESPKYGMGYTMEISFGWLGFIEMGKEVWNTMSLRTREERSKVNFNF